MQCRCNPHLGVFAQVVFEELPGEVDPTPLFIARVYNVPKMKMQERHLTWDELEGSPSQFLQDALKIFQDKYVSEEEGEEEEEAEEEEEEAAGAEEDESDSGSSRSSASRSSRRSLTPPLRPTSRLSTVTPLLSSDDEADVEPDRRQPSRVKHIDFVQIGNFELAAWYHSPYPDVYRTAKKLFVCQYCLKYCCEYKSLCHHMKECTRRRPPGKLIYTDGRHSVWEVDGKEHKLYCQCVSRQGRDTHVHVRPLAESWIALC